MGARLHVAGAWAAPDQVRIAVALALVRTYGERVPTTREIRDRFGTSRATAYRWRVAYAAALGVYLPERGSVAQVRAQSPPRR
mgnify:CR=1 FL=1